MALKDLKHTAVKFGSGQPTNLGGRKKREPFINTLIKWFEKDGKVKFHPDNVKLLPDGFYEVRMPNEEMLATKFMQMTMKGDARFMEMYFKLFGEYQAEKHDVNVNQFPLQGIDFSKLTEEQQRVLEEIGRNAE